MTVKYIDLDDYFHDMINVMILSNLDKIEEVDGAYFFTGETPTYESMKFNLTHYLNSLNNYLTILVSKPSELKNLKNRTSYFFDDRKMVKDFKKAVEDVLTSDFLKVSVNEV